MNSSTTLAVRLDGPPRLAEVVRGVRFVDGEPQVQDAA